MNPQPQLPPTPEAPSEPRRSTCARCGFRITFVPSTEFTSGKWLSNPRRPASWHCGTDPAFPVRGHVPVEEAGQ
jgi:hypothetical protein